MERLSTYLSLRFTRLVSAIPRQVCHPSFPAALAPHRRPPPADVSSVAGRNPDAVRSARAGGVLFLGTAANPGWRVAAGLVLICMRMGKMWTEAAGAFRRPGFLLAAAGSFAFGPPGNKAQCVALRRVMRSPRR